MLEVLDEHRVILWLALAYILFGGLVQLTLGRAWPLQVTSPLLVYAWLVAAFFWLLWERSLQPGGLRGSLGQHMGGAAFIVALAGPVQITFQSLKQSIGPTVGFTWDIWLSKADQFLHGGPAWYWFQPIVRSGNVLAAFDLVYRSWFVVLFGFFLWACWSTQRTLRSRAIVAFLLLWILGGTLTAWMFASAGPCYYHRVAKPDPAYTELIHTLRSHGPLWATFSHDALWTWYDDDEWRYFGGISAFPSMHVGAAVLFALIAWNAHRGMGALLWIFAVLTQVGSVVLAWHYAIDGYAGALIAWGCWAWAGRIAGGVYGRPIPHSVAR